MKSIQIAYKILRKKTINLFIELVTGIKKLEKSFLIFLLIFFGTFYGIIKYIHELKERLF
jgi:hypothetical protein